MTIRDMRIFCVVADCGKMIDASRQLYIAPASVSQTIAEIEDEFGTRLFERLNKKLYITDAGAKLQAYSKHILNLYEDMERTMKIGVSSLSVRIGTTGSIAACLMPRILHRCQRKCPMVDFKVFEESVAGIEKQLIQSELDVGVIAGEMYNKDIISTPIMKDRLVLICGKKSPFYGRQKVSAMELQDQPFILHEEGCVNREKLREFLEKYDFTVKEKWVCKNSESVAGAVSANHGISLVSKMLADCEYKNDNLHCFEVEGEEFSYNICLAYHKNKYIFQALQCFLMACQNKC